MEPYQDNKPSIITKKDIIGKLVTVHGTKRENRGIKPIVQRSRAVRAGDIHELITAGTPEIEQGIINNTAYIGFVEFLTGGLLINGDKLYIRDRCIGNIVGFDETHIPNHLNIIIDTVVPITGYELNAEIGNAVLVLSDDMHRLSGYQDKGRGSDAK